MTRGRAVLCRPVRTAARATRPGKEDLLVAGPGVAELGEHLAEHEEQEQRLQDHLGQEDRELPPGDEEVAAEDGQRTVRPGPQWGSWSRPHRWPAPTSAAASAVGRSSQRPSGQVDEDVLEVGLAQPGVGEPCPGGADGLGHRGHERRRPRRPRRSATASRCRPGSSSRSIWPTPARAPTAASQGGARRFRRRARWCSRGCARRSCPAPGRPGCRGPAGCRGR